MKPLADQIEAIAMMIVRGAPTIARQLRDIAEKVRELERRGYVPDETQAPYIAGPALAERRGENMADDRDPIPEWMLSPIIPLGLMGMFLLCVWLFG